jgi:5-methylcytosine-specific restriction endonuclease McrA
MTETPKRYPCDRCGKEHNRKYELDSHKKTDCTKNPNPPRQLKKKNCKFCNMESVRFDYLYGEHLNHCPVYKHLITLMNSQSNNKKTDHITNVPRSKTKKCIFCGMESYPRYLYGEHLNSCNMYKHLVSVVNSKSDNDSYTINGEIKNKIINGTSKKYDSCSSDSISDTLSSEESISNTSSSENSEEDTSISSDNEKKKTSRYVSNQVRNKIIAKQKFRCANDPDASIRFIGNFECPRWKTKGLNKGTFLETNYELDHIKEFSDGGTNDKSNLQYLCMDCHAIKTKKYLSYKARKNKLDKEYEMKKKNLDNEYDL